MSALLKESRGEMEMAEKTLAMPLWLLRHQRAPPLMMSIWAEFMPCIRVCRNRSDRMSSSILHSIFSTARGLTSRLRSIHLCSLTALSVASSARSFHVSNGR